MKALIFQGSGKKALEERPKATIAEPTDAIVKITKTTICGTDLHILKGDVPTCQAGRVLGHEGVGFIEAVGPGVVTFKPGERVLISCISACGKCEYCRKGMYSHCINGGWILGNTIDGTQTEYVRIPYADTSLYRVADDADEEALVMLSDILPTGFECGVLNGKIQPGATVAIVGAGPVGLAALLTNHCQHRRAWIESGPPFRATLVTQHNHYHRLVDTFSTPMLLKTVQSRKVNPKLLVTHHFPLDRILEAYDTFGKAASTQALKVIIET